MTEKFEALNPRELRAHPANSRRHPAHQIAALVRGFREFGFQGVVIVDEANTILAGHGRVQAAIEAGIPQVPAKRVLGWSETKKRAFVIADNQLALASEWDEEQLGRELRALMDAEDVELSALGFADQQLNELIAASSTATDGDQVAWSEADAVPETPAPAQTVSVLGDLWHCGDHRVLCGDSTSVAALQRLVGDDRLDLWITDPPYNVDYQGGTKDALQILNDSMDDARFRQFLAAAYRAADAVLKEGASFYIWHADGEQGFNFRAAARDVGWQIRQCIIWRKHSLVMGRQDYQWQHEPCLYGWKAGAAHRWYGGRKQTSVATIGALSPFVQLDERRWQVSVDGRILIVEGDAQVSDATPTVMKEAKPRRNGEHPTMKPVALFERQILNSTPVGALVGDSFGGSGTTLIASEITARRARVAELDPRYVDVIVRRWQEFTGQEARLDGDGDTFAAVGARRLEGAAS